MHDPMVVAFDIRRPWPRVRRGKAPGSRGRRFAVRHADAKWWKPWQGWKVFWQIGSRELYWPSLVTIWHVEPNGRDSGEVCKHHTRVRDANGEWSHRVHRRWKWHVHHWKIQVHPLQHLRRNLLTRCAWCGGRQRKHDPVNVSHSWDGPRGRWWQGEPELFHHDCSSIDRAHRICLCADGVGIWEHELSDYPYGNCLTCGKHRGWKSDESRDGPATETDRILASIPQGERDPVKHAQVTAMWKAYREATEPTP